MSTSASAGADSLAASAISPPNALLAIAVGATRSQANDLTAVEAKWRRFCRWHYHRRFSSEIGRQRYRTAIQFPIPF